jgi:hypothetical protein
MSPICRTCNNDFPVDAFYQSPTNKCGYSTECKECTKKRSRRRELRLRALPFPVLPVGFTAKCGKCGKELSISNFKKQKTGKDGLFPWCKPCENAYMRPLKRNWQNRICSSRSEKELLAAIPESKYCCRCHQILPSDAFARCRSTRDNLNTYCRQCGIQKHAMFRLEVLRHYSDYVPSCACCSEARIEFLAIDHINGGGQSHLREIGRMGHTFYHWLKNSGFPEGFRVLCHNCNMARGLYGICPHEKEMQVNVA